MPDICKCEGTNCPLKERCYRFMVIPFEFQQSYFAEVPYNKEEEKCEYFWDIKIYKHGNKKY